MFYTFCCVVLNVKQNLELTFYNLDLFFNTFIYNNQANADDDIYMRNDNSVPVSFFFDFCLLLWRFYKKIYVYVICRGLALYYLGLHNLLILKSRKNNKQNSGNHFLERSRIWQIKDLTFFYAKAKKKLKAKSCSDERLNKFPKEKFIENIFVRTE